MPKRIDWIDAAKGLGIILVVLGHTPTTEWLKTFIFSFHMPLFFFLSGVVYRDENMTFSSFLLKKMKTLLLPYFIFSVIAYLYWLFVERHFKFSGSSDVDPIVPFKGIFYSIPDGYMLTHNPALWFLTCLFIVDMLFFWLKKTLKDHDVVLVVTVSGLFGYINYQYLGLKLPWNIEVALTALGFYAAGFFLRHMLKADRHRKTLLMSLFLFILVGFLQSQNVRVDMRANEYGNMAIFYVASCLGTAGVILISFKLQHAALLQFLGRNSLIILVLHYPVIRMLKAIIYYFMNVSLDETYGSVLWGGVYTAVTLLIMVPCILLLNRYPVLLGRKKRC
ncbi:acyltransferase family protein [Bacillus sonorensis]|uniref:acyltransferase family protein n=1 Tax=Bacillus sonorensis TaxID=119858 RepID=UPI00228289D3|nr:acyltransferase family protein [Bacillus sonorensis]MCZ0070740.1 acyltransferase family protein [Bacillus sonorensis]MCZ0098183.1 acyltransferase family protein [Bacillus sonorensis]MEC1356459.1 acyltransferase family protein [Bacillus sonorensis]MEC1427857.1 acyltransferase family protein [Bacillus sonorensis]MEC1519709.1 acyltransferase family protein [Bacillus sonorensis]